MRRVFLVLLALLCVTPAYAQKTKAQLTTEVNTNFPDNTSGLITPALVRTTIIDIINSYYDLNGGTTLSCGANQWINSFPNLSAIACTGTSGLGTSLITGATLALAQTHCGVLVQRAASGSVMTDTLAAGGVASGCVITVKNVDATAPYEVTVSGGTLDGVASGFVILGVNQTASIQFDGTNFHVVFAPSRVNSGPSGITFYVAASLGNDANHGLTSGAPFATRQKCWAKVQQQVDLGGTVLGATGFTCQLLDGTYADATMQAVGSLTGQDFAAKVVFQGNCTTPGNVVINSAGAAYTGDDKAMFAIRCQRITTSLNGSNLILMQHTGTLLVVLDKIEMSGGAATGSHFVAQVGAGIVFTANYKIMAGGGGSGCSWAVASQGNIILLNSVVVDQTGGGIGFSIAWACAFDLGYLSGIGLTFNGGSTGSRYAATNNSIINTGGGGANFFSGSSPGSTSGGAIYE